MTDIVERLKGWDEDTGEVPFHWLDLCEEASHEIAELRAALSASQARMAELEGALSDADVRLRDEGVSFYSPLRQRIDAILRRAALTPTGAD